MAHQAQGLDGAAPPLPCPGQSTEPGEEERRAPRGPTLPGRTPTLFRQARPAVCRGAAPVPAEPEQLPGWRREEGLPERKCRGEPWGGAPLEPQSSSSGREHTQHGSRAGRTSCPLSPPHRHARTHRDRPLTPARAQEPGDRPSPPPRWSVSPALQHPSWDLNSGLLVQPLHCSSSRRGGGQSRTESSQLAHRRRDGFCIPWGTARPASQSTPPPNGPLAFCSHCFRASSSRCSGGHPLGQAYYWRLQTTATAKNHWREQPSCPTPMHGCLLLQADLPQGVGRCCCSVHGAGARSSQKPKPRKAPLLCGQGQAIGGREGRCPRGGGVEALKGASELGPQPLLATLKLSERQPGSPAHPLHPQPSLQLPTRRPLASPAPSAPGRLPLPPGKPPPPATRPA